MSNRCPFCGSWKPRDNLACDLCLDKLEAWPGRILALIALLIPLAVCVVTWIALRAAR